MERLRELQYKAARKITGGYHGSSQDLIEIISKLEPVQTKLWDMKMRAVARILENVQDDLYHKAEENRGDGLSWCDHGLTWAAVKPPHYRTCLEDILAAMGENGERQIDWHFPREGKANHTIQRGDLGTKDTIQIVWEMRIRDPEEEGWTTAFTDGSGLNDKAAGGFCANPKRLDTVRQPDLSGSGYRI